MMVFVMFNHRCGIIMCADCFPCLLDVAMSRVSEHNSVDLGWARCVSRAYLTDPSS